MPQEKIGEFDACLVEEFMRALAFGANFNLHLRLEYGGNAHHIAEAIFKAAARAIRMAVKVEGDGVPSTKGVIA
jgi:imidazoleglycerol-phosphate dehydratase